MESWLFAHLALLYWGVPIFLGIFLGIWEMFRPRRIHALSKTHRWLTHGFLNTLGDAIVVLIFPVGAVAVAFAVRNSAYGVLNHATLPLPVNVLLTFLLLDLYHYASHYLRHSIPLLWRFHQVHHSDRDFDVATAFRFHPGESLLAQAPYLLLIAVLAPTPIAMVCYELANIAQNVWSHANLRLPQRLERACGSILVTPEFHRIHHSIDADEQMSNLAVLFSFWDRLFHTYRAHPSAGEDNISFGLEEVTATQSIQPLAMLALPFSRQPTALLQPQSALQVDIGRE